MEVLQIALVVAVYLAFLALNVWMILIRPVRPWKEKLGTLLQILGLYTFGFGVLAQKDLFPKELTDELTSPNLFLFLAGNGTLMSVGTAALSMALDPVKTSFAPSAFLQAFGMLAFGVLSMAYFLLYAFVVAPLSYLAYVVVSVPLSAVTASAHDITFMLDDKPFSISKIVTDHPAVVRNFMVSLSSLLLKTSLDLPAWFRKARAGSSSGPPDSPGWLKRHPHIGRAALLGSEGLLSLLVLTLAVSAFILPSMVTGDAETPDPTGEMIGAEIVTAIAICGLVVLVLKARRRRKMLV